MASLDRSLGLGQVIFLGVGSILGAGIYTLIGIRCCVCTTDPLHQTIVDHERCILALRPGALIRDEKPNVVDECAHGGN